MGWITVFIKKGKKKRVNGVVRCPCCNKVYRPLLRRPSGDDRGVDRIFPAEPAWKREQLVSGICSDECFDKVFSNVF